MKKAFVDDDLIDQSADAYPDSYNNMLPEASEKLSVYGQKKRELPEQMNQASDEIERLRQRQENLERRKQELVDQRKRIEAFERNRDDILKKLGRSAVLIVREGEQASRMSALCNEVSSLFSRLHKEMETFHPERWTEEEYDAKLTQALAKVEAATTEYRKAMDSINALTWNRDDKKESVSDALSLDSTLGLRDRKGLPNTFAGWLLAGLAFTLPLLIAGILITLLIILKPFA